MRESARHKIDNFFDVCQRNIDTLSPEKVREKQSRYLDEEKKFSYPNNLGIFLFYKFFPFIIHGLVSCTNGVVIFMYRERMGKVWCFKLKIVPLQGI